MNTEMNLGENIIFLISLPRSGSTLLQHILASHSRVAATAEPWILFPTAYALRSGALTADYNASIGQIALSEFLAQLSSGDEQYYAAVRKMALELYEAYLAKCGKERFLDKTSRYYLILPELFRIFPKAKFVFLLRNPLAVLASFLENMVFGDWRRLGEPGIRNDLLDGYQLIRQGMRHFGDDAIVVKYEDLVEAPQKVLVRLCAQLEIEFEPEMLNYGQKVGVLPGKLVDPKSIRHHQAPVEDYAHVWRTIFTDRQVKHFGQAFLNHLGPELVQALGYSYQDMASVVSDGGKSSAPMMRWEVLMRPSAQRTLLERWQLQLAYVWQKEGMLNVVSHVQKRIAEYAFRALRGVWWMFWKRVRNMPLVVPFRGFVRGLCWHPSPSASSNSAQPASSEYRVVARAHETSVAGSQGWRSASIAEKQLDAYIPLLKTMYEGKPRQDFDVAAQAFRLTNLAIPSLIEIGCGNGYYYEILSHLTRRPIEYVGVDYSPAMIESASGRYPSVKFSIGDAVHLPFADSTFDVAWSGTVLMHLMNYRQAVAETCRVARSYCIFHSTPVLANKETMFLTKDAYGVRVAEVIIGQIEFENLLHEHGLVIRHILESLPYNVNHVVDGIVHTLTYVCEKS